MDLTESGHSDRNPSWALDGKAITYMTGRYGMKAQGSWGNQEDVMLMVLDPEAWDNFNLSEEEQALKEKEEKDKENADNSDKSKDKRNLRKRTRKNPKTTLRTLRLNLLILTLTTDATVWCV